MSEKKVKLNNITLGDGNVYIQSMLNIPAYDVTGNVCQALELERLGCEIVRVSVPTIEDVQLIPAIKKKLTVPLVADIHFDYRIAVECVNAGVDKIRINPGNIGDDSKIKAVVDACRSRGVPIRIGVNSGSLEKDVLAKYGSPTASALVESAMNHIRILERFDFDDIVISLKSSDVPVMIKAYRMLSEQCPYPLHLGVTEAGTERMGIIKSSIGIGSLLCDGIGDTIRVSLTANPVYEIAAAKDILKAIDLRKGVRIISCPTCGRTKIDLIGLTEKVESATKNLDKDIKIAVMGCIVNGPGEAREADIGIAGGNGEGLIFKKGEIIRKVTEKMLLSELMYEIEKM